MVNLVHTKVLETLRALTADDSLNFPLIASLDDNQTLRFIFTNYRDEKGVRLTGHGVTILKSVFRSYSFPLPPDFRLSPAMVVWLDRQSPMPYFLSNDNITVFDATLAVRLKLANADLSLLVAAS